MPVIGPPRREFGTVEKIYRSFRAAKRRAHFQAATLAAHFLRYVDDKAPALCQVPAEARQPNAVGGKKTTRGAPAVQYGDVVKYRALAIDVEYRSALGQPDSGLVNSSAPAARFARLLCGKFEPLSFLVVCCGSGQG